MRIHLHLLLLIACAEPADPPDPPDPPAPDTPSFTAAPGSAPSLRLTGAFDGPQLTVEIWAEELGPVFGVAGRLRFDPTHLEVERAELEPALLPDAAELIRSDADRIVFGVARKGASLGDAPLEGSVLLATVRFTPLRAGDSELSLSRAMVRRADGSFLPAAFLGAGVHTAGGSP